MLSSLLDSWLTRWSAARDGDGSSSGAFVRFVETRAGSLRLTREGWEGVIAKMIGLGARATDAEFEQITDYLATNYKGEAPKPINMNSASSVELESVAGLLRKEAAIWIAYRNKNPPCKALDDLKKVPGLPFKKIDERRDRLVCF